MKRSSKLAAGLVVLAGGLWAQDVTAVLNGEQLALTQTSVILTVTATGGDGSVCTLVKIPSNTISATLKCQTADGKTTTGQQPLRSTSASPVFMPWGFGDIFCMIVVNPTAAAVTEGSLGSIPANSVGWSCTSFTRLNGTISGNTAPSNGSVSWP